jgi:hypothetical protein
MDDEEGEVDEITLARENALLSSHAGSMSCGLYTACACMVCRRHGGCCGKQGCSGRLGTAHPLAPGCWIGDFIGCDAARTIQCQCECTYIAVPVLLQVCRTSRLTVCT